MDRYAAGVILLCYKFGLANELRYTLPAGVHWENLTNDDWLGWIMNQEWTQHYSFRAKRIKRLKLE